MKLRNKQTGEIYSAWSIRIGEEEITSVEQFNDTFEDYKPAEPLIKDEKIRKAVRAWAEANGDSAIVVHPIDGETTLLNGSFTGLNIEFDIMDELENGKDYTIDELCGEEEE